MADDQETVTNLRKTIQYLQDRYDKETDQDEKNKLKGRIEEAQGKVIAITSKKSGTGKMPDKSQAADIEVSLGDELDLLLSRIPVLKPGPAKDALKARAQQIVDALTSGKDIEKGTVHPQNKAALDKYLKQVRQKLSREDKKNEPDKKLVKALKQSAQDVKPRRFSSGTFNLPQFTSDNSTTIVLICILICFFLELDAGTKFVNLWNDAFSPASTSNGQNNSTSNDTSTSQNHDNISPLQQTEQNLSNLDNNIASNFGAGLRTVYGVPSEFHFLDGVVW